MKASIVVLALLLFACCDRLRRDASRPQDARGDTPIRYVLCGADGTECFVAARFANMAACEIHEKRQAAACAEDTAHPGRIVCDPNPQPSTTTKSYCLP